MKKCFLIWLTIIIVIIAAFSACSIVLATTIEDINKNIKNNENKITLIQETKENLHIAAESLRDNYIDGSEIALTLSDKWNELDSREQSLIQDNKKLNEKKEKLSNMEVYLGEFVSTSYCAENYAHSPCNTGIPLKTATGGTPVPYQTVAVDPSIIPLGTRLKIQHPNGTVYNVVANDTGGAIKGRKIDMVLPTHNEALQWGRQTLKVWKIN